MSDGDFDEERSDRLRRLLDRFKRRRLVQWTVAYVAGAWVLLQGLDLVGNRFGWPDVVLRLVIVVLGAGLLAAVIIGWYHGEKGEQRIRAAELLMLAGVCVLAGGAILLVVATAPRSAQPVDDDSKRTPGSDSVPSTAERGSVAVLPFLDLSPGGGSEYLGDGIAEALIGALTRVDGLRVAGRTSAFTFRKRDDDVRVIGRRLGVAAVLSGSVQRVGESLRVSVQLVSTADGFQIWAEHFDRRIEDIFAVQDEVAGAVVASLPGLLGVGVAPVTTGTRDLGAYDAYLLGRFYWNRRTRADLERAVPYFEAAVAADSSYALAWSGLADTHVLLLPEQYGGAAEHRRNRLALAEVAARRAVAIDPALAEGHTSLALVVEQKGDLDEAEAHYRRAIALNPRYPTATAWYAGLLSRLGRFQEALDAALAARELEPLSPGINGPVIAVYDALGQWDAAEAALQRALPAAGESPVVYQFAFLHCLIAADFERAADFLYDYLIRGGASLAQAARARTRLRDAATRADALHGLAARPGVEFVLRRVVQGDEAALAYLATVASGPDRRNVAIPTVQAYMGPGLRADPRMARVLAELARP